VKICKVHVFTMAAAEGERVKYHLFPLGGGGDGVKAA
jgi:hypothetical protein